ncbi:MAG: hypothetical protein IJW83_04385, partial [Clostridia bacterium]|nr:hypothetical protein [Clostridia bacterium]
IQCFHYSISIQINICDILYRLSLPLFFETFVMGHQETKVRFLNDVCLRQMMLALPMMTASPNDAWLRHILWQTSHHCGTK